MASDEPVLEPEDRALLERLVARVVALRMEVPAILTLESTRPLTVVASQAMLVFEPLVQALFGFREYRRVAALIERREVMEFLTRRIEAEAAAREERRAAPGDRAR